MQGDTFRSSYEGKTNNNNKEPALKGRPRLEERDQIRGSLMAVGLYSTWHLMTCQMEGEE